MFTSCCFPWDWRQRTTVKELRQINWVFRNMNAVERSYMPLVAKNGCVDIRALRKALRLINHIRDEHMRRRLVIYHYKRLTEPDGDVIMEDVEDVK